jgi:hypothetical protein
MTTMETKPHEGNGAFSGGMTKTGPEPTARGTLEAGARTSQKFKFKLAQNGLHLGWLGLTGSQSMWWSVVDNESEATTWEWYNDTSGSYLKNPAWTNGNGTWSTGLSGQPCACNDWAHAGPFKLVGDRLTAGDGSTVGQYKSDLQWLYANSDYPVLAFSMV